jgi:hypothetical protein
MSGEGTHVGVAHDGDFTQGLDFDFGDAALVGAELLGGNDA